MLMRALRGLALAGALCGVLLTSGCANYGELLFVKDERLRFTAPKDYEEVETPVRVEWTMEDFEVLPPDADVEPTEEAGYFAVFVDRAPIKPGRTLEDVADRDPACKADPRCPDKQYLNANGVYVTRKPQVTLSTVAPLDNKERVQLHQLTVILLDSEGRRIGEYAWFLRFKLESQVFGL